MRIASHWMLWIGTLALVAACNQKAPPDKLDMVVSFVDDLDPLVRSCQAHGDEPAPETFTVFINEVYAGDVGNERVDWIEIHNEAPDDPTTRRGRCNCSRRPPRAHPTRARASAAVRA